MTNQELSDTFTTMLNSYNTQAQFGEEASKMEIVLDEYEKSVLLTQAQDLITKSYFDGTLNPQGQGFDDSARRQIDFSSLIEVATRSALSTQPPTFDDRGIVFRLPMMPNPSNPSNELDGTCKVLFMLNEKIECRTVTAVSTDELDDTKVNVTYGPKQTYVVVPINFKEYDREMSKPFAQPLKKQAWRLFQNDSTGYDVDSEIIVKQSIYDHYSASPSAEGDIDIQYKIRYVRRPRPIVLEDLPNNLAIDGVSTESTCELNPILHSDILNKAVELALATRGRVQPQQSQN